MPQFIMLKKTAFRNIEDSFPQHSRATSANVRRPYMGIQDVKDRHGTMTVFTREGKQLDFLDMHSLTAKRRTKQYTNFVVQSIQRSSREKYQIQETWGADWLILYGRKPEVWVVTGELVSSIDFPWEAEFWHNYNNLLRGTKLAELGGRLFFEVDNLYMSGYILEATARKEVQFKNKVPFQFSIFVTHDGYLDTWEEDRTVVNLSPNAKGKISLGTLPAAVNLQEYAQMGTPVEMPKKSPKAKTKWRTVRKNVLERKAPTLKNNPHVAAKVIGATASGATPPTYAKQLGRGFRGGTPPPSKTVKARKRNGSYTQPFTFDFLGKRAMSQARNLFKRFTSGFSQQDLRSLVGNAKKIANLDLGAFGNELDKLLKNTVGSSELNKFLGGALGKGEALLNSVLGKGVGKLFGQADQLLSTAEKRAVDVVNQGTSALAKLRKQLFGDALPPVEQHLRSYILKAGVARTMEQARAQLRTAKAHVSQPVRFPKPGVFLIP